jgi:hypothetical protein
MVPRAQIALLATVLAGVAGAAALGAGCGESSVTTTSATVTAPGAGAHRDAFGDVTPGEPDLTALRITNDARAVRMAFTFAGAPPLATNLSAGWTDMLLMGIDVPPIGSKPTPNGWMGVDYALGMHGVDDRAVFRDMHQTKRQMTTLRSHVSGRTITIDLPRTLIGDPAYFDFNVSVGREGGDQEGSGDSIPATGTLRYRMTGD